MKRNRYAEKATMFDLSKDSPEVKQIQRYKSSNKKDVAVISVETQYGIFYMQVREYEDNGEAMANLIRKEVGNFKESCYQIMESRSQKWDILANEFRYQFDLKLILEIGEYNDFCSKQTRRIAEAILTITNSWQEAIELLNVINAQEVWDFVDKEGKKPSDVINALYYKMKNEKVSVREGIINE